MRRRRLPAPEVPRPVPAAAGHQPQRADLELAVATGIRLAPRADTAHRSSSSQRIGIIPPPSDPNDALSVAVARAQAVARRADRLDPSRVSRTGGFLWT